MLVNHIMNQKEILIAPKTDAIIPSGVIDKPSVGGAFIFSPMKLIPLSRGLSAQVDDSKYDYLRQWKWSALKGRKTFYAVRRYTLNSKVYYIYMERLILNVPKTTTIDHADGNGLNNQAFNLRGCTHSQNSGNMRKKTERRFKGAYFDKRRDRWYSRITINYKSIHIGMFDTDLEAALAYDEAAKKYFGEFANLNFK